MTGKTGKLTRNRRTILTPGLAQTVAKPATLGVSVNAARSGRIPNPAILGTAADAEVTPIVDAARDATGARVTHSMSSPGLAEIVVEKMMLPMSTVPAEAAGSLVTSDGSMTAGSARLVGVQIQQVHVPVVVICATHTDQTTGITTIDQLSATCLADGLDGRANRAAVRDFRIPANVENVDSISREEICKTGTAVVTARTDARTAIPKFQQATTRDPTDVAAVAIAADGGGDTEGIVIRVALQIAAHHPA